MGVKFLSEEWTKEVANALNSSEDFKSAAANQDAKIQQVITEAPEGEIKYHMTFKGGAVEIGTGEMAEAEATITQSYETAAAVSKGELDGTTAFMQGKVKVAGNMMKVMALSGVFATIGNAVKDIEVDY